MPRSIFLSREALFLLAVCMVDMLTSAWLFHHQLAVEGNPLLVQYAEAGTLPFLSAKTMTFLPALVIGEWYGRRRPELVRPLLRWAAVLYLVIYAVLVGVQFVR
jgi:hypothetical protein